MTNPFQHGSPSFFGDDYLSTGQRRSSYASIVSGAGQSRSTRASAFSHLLNPSPDGDMHANSLYSTSRGHHFGSTSRGEQQEDMSGPWPRTTGGVPWFSRAFDMYMNKEPVVVSDEYSSTPNISSTGFLSPSYLKGSVYLQKLEDAHRAKVLAHREGHATQSQTGSGLVGGAGNLSLHPKLPPGSHRGVSFELVENLPVAEDDETLSPLPSKWNKDDKWPGLEVMGDGFEVKFTGQRSQSERDHEAYSIRANHYMPSQCGVYYFEVLILNRKREDTTIGIGFSTKSVALSRAPGWEPESWGYHGDDGNCFGQQNVGKSYGPTFGAGDTVGCLVNFRLGLALFTRNGDELPTAFRDVNYKDIKGKLYPTVGLKKPGDHVYVNFGQVPFQFDIDGYMRRQQKMIFESIEGADTSILAPPLSETELIQQLVLQFLQHDGYVETARAFAEEIHAEKKALNLDADDQVEGINIKDDEDANNRQRIRRAILEGDIDKALKYTDASYPQVLKDNEQVYFRLRCRKFIEMIRKEAELNLLLEKKGIRRSRAVEDDEEMLEADGNSPWSEEMDTEDGIDGAGVSKLSQEALAYGMELRSEFNADPRREVAKHLDEIFALIAYPNPLKVKEVAPLLDRTGRVAVAEELNSAILMSLGKSSRAALENVYAQTCVLLEDLRQDGGDGAFVTVQSVVDDIPKSTLL